MALTTEQVRAIVNDSIAAMKHALWLGAWRIKVRYGRLQEGRAAEVAVNIRYQSATITFDPEVHDTKAEVLESVRHELLHLVCGYYEHAEAVVFSFLLDQERGAATEAFHLAAEHAVSHLERVFDGIGMTPARLVARGKRELGVD